MMTKEAREPTEQEVEAVKMAIGRYYIRMHGAAHIYAVCDGHLAWDATPLQTGLQESEARDIAREMNARAAIAAMASGKVRYIRCHGDISGQESKRVCQHPIYRLGDTALVWANEGDLLALAQDIDAEPTP
jgi:hypothetical protein